MSSFSASVVLGVTAASGKLGGSIVRQLVADFTKRSLPLTNIVAFVRSTTSPASQAVAKLGVTVRVADYNHTADALTTAFQGVYALVVISGTEFGSRVAQHARVFDAAIAAGVKRLLYTSLLHGDASLLKLLSPEHVGTEAALKQKQAESKGSFVYTILRNGWYTENYAGSIAGAVATGSLLGASGDGKISAATIEDFAAAAAAVLATPVDQHTHDNATYELAGDNAFTLSELAAELSKQTGKAIVFSNKSESELAAILAQTGVPAQFAAVIAACDTAAGQAGLFNDKRQLSTLIGRPTTPLAVAVKQILAAPAPQH